MSVPEELKGRKGSELTAEVATPILVAIIYGIYEFIRWGISSDYKLYTYAPVIGGIAALVGLSTYFFRVISPNFAKVSWRNLLVLLGFLPYLFLIYVIGFLGLYTVYKGVMVSFSIWTILAGAFGSQLDTVAFTNSG